MWASIDNFQLDRWQFVATWFERLTGRSYFDAARFAMVVAFAGTVLNWFHETDPTGKIAMGLVVVLALGLVVIAFLQVSSLEDMSKRSNFANPERHSRVSSINRALQSYFAASSIFGFIKLGGIQPSGLITIGLWAYHYLIACEMPPPYVKKESVENLQPQAT